ESQLCERGNQSGRAPDLPRLGSADDGGGSPGARANYRAPACHPKRKALAWRCAQHVFAVSRVLRLLGRMDGLADRSEPTLSFAMSRPELGNHKLTLAKAHAIIRVAPRNAARPQRSRGSLLDAFKSPVGHQNQFKCKMALDGGRRRC